VTAPAAPRRRAIAVAAAAAALGCGGSRPPAAAPAPPAPAANALRLHRELGELATIARRERASCPRLAAALRELFARMRDSVAAAEQLARDPARARELTAALRAYDDLDRAAPEAIAADLAPCSGDREVREVMAAMPILPSLE
jgi:hypothetical protein